MFGFSANLSFLYTELPFLDRFAAAAADDFSAIEFVSPFDLPPEILAMALARHDLVQDLFNLPAGNWQAGERGIACLPDRIAEFRRGIDQAIVYGNALGCSKVNCLAGIAPEGVEPERLDSVLFDNLRYAAPRLADAGIKLLLEPVNNHDIPNFHLTQIDQAEAMLDAVGSNNLFIQFDVYHTQVMQGDLIETYERLHSLIGHIQIADNPGRHEPGTGEINYMNIFAAIERLGYNGYIGCEYRPLTTTTAGLGWIRDWEESRRYLSHSGDDGA